MSASKAKTLLRQRFAQQLENTGAVSEAESRTHAAEADLDRIDGQIALARNQLAALVGKGPDRGLDIPLPANPKLQAFGIPANLSADLIGRRPDIVAARLRADGASKRIDVAHADFYPNINLTGYAGYQALGSRDLLISGFADRPARPRDFTADLRRRPDRRRLSRRPRRI